MQKPGRIFKLTGTGLVMVVIMVSLRVTSNRSRRTRRGMEGATVKAEREILRKQWSEPSASSDMGLHRCCTELLLTGTEVMVRKKY